MLDRTNAALRIAREMKEFETSLNDALACSTALAHSIARGRNIEGVGPFRAQESLIRLAAVQQHLTKCAGEATRVHRDLRRTGDDITAMPDSNGDCPELERFAPAGVHAA